MSTGTIPKPIPSQAELSGLPWESAEPLAPEATPPYRGDCFGPLLSAAQSPHSLHGALQGSSRPWEGQLHALTHAISSSYADEPEGAVAGLDGDGGGGDGGGGGAGEGGAGAGGSGGDGDGGSGDRTATAIHSDLMAAAPRASMEPALSPVAVAKALLPLTAAPTAQGDGLPGADWMPSRVAFEAPAPPAPAPPPSAPPPPSAVWAQQAHHQQQAQQARQAQQQAQQLQQAQQAQQQWQQQAQQAQQQQLALESPLKQQQRLAVESEAARKRSCATASAGRHPATASPGRQPAIAASSAIDELHWCAPHHRPRRRCTTRFTTGATSV